MTRQEAAGRDVVLLHSTGQGAADHAEHIRRQVGAVAAPVVLAHSGSGPLLVEVAPATSTRGGPHVNLLGGRERSRPESGECAW